MKGEPAHLQCSALGDTPMEINWKVGGQHISKDGDQRLDDYFYLFKWQHVKMKLKLLTTNMTFQIGFCFRKKTYMLTFFTIFLERKRHKFLY